MVPGIMPVIPVSSALSVIAPFAAFAVLAVGAFPTLPLLPAVKPSGFPLQSRPYDDSFFPWFRYRAFLGGLPRALLFLTIRFRGS